MKGLILKNMLGSLVMNLGVILYAYVAMMDAQVKPLMGSSIRVIMNLGLALALWAFLPRMRAASSLLGKNKFHLLLFGILGTSTLVSYFKAVDRIGVSTAGFLLNSSGSVLIVLLALTKKKISIKEVASAVVCVFGAALLVLDASGIRFVPGFHWGVISALSAGAAYFVMGCRLQNESVVSTMFYWSFVNLIFHGLALTFISEHSLPDSWESLVLLVFSGLLAAGGQFWVNASFQTPRGAMMGILSYMNCVMAAILEVLMLGKRLSSHQVLGIFLIVMTGLSTAFLRRSENFATTEVLKPT